MDSDTQIIYILTNPSMPGIIKIGITSQDTVEIRMKQLYTTGVPVPFECNYACKVRGAHEVEKSIHFAFGDLRVNPNREFFRLSPERVVAILQHLQVEDVTEEFNKEIDSETDAEDKDSAKRLRDSRRPNLNFTEIGIHIGAILKFRDGPQEVKVLSDKKVDYLGEELSLTMATRKILNRPDDYPIQPSPYWNFNGRRLIDMYEEHHAGD